MLTGKVLITGGSGFLGRGIMRRAKVESWPCQITIYSRDEYKQELCRRLYPDARYLLGDVKDRERLEAAMVGHDYVIHAAAVKFIPEAEFNVSECISVNVEGSANVIWAAVHAGVSRVVAISTDKAVQPVNVYGASKFLMERLFAETAQRLDTELVSVRYGNVIGSTGSVIPLFKNQIKTAGKVFLTDTRMTRFWLSIDEAINLILMALSWKIAPGSVVVPRPKAMKMLDLAECIAEKHDVPVEITGIRPGEKLDEMLMSYQESVRTVLRTDFEIPVYELKKVGTKVEGTEPFTLASHTPDGWISRSEMIQHITDAENV